MDIETIKAATGLDFTGAEHILACRLQGKSVNGLIAEIKEQFEREALENEGMSTSDAQAVMEARKNGGAA